MCKIISIINNKGGVAKTTSTGIIAQILAYLGKKILVVDLDESANLSMLLNAYTADSDAVINNMAPAPNPHVAELFRYRYRNTEEVETLIYPTSIKNISIIPSSERHGQSQLYIQNNTGNNNIILRRALNAVKNQYDYILIDNAPAKDILTVNSMFASDLILIPVRLEEYSYKGLQETLNTVTYIKEEHELENPKIGGVFMTQAETNTNIYKDLSVQYADTLGTLFCKTCIRKDIKICEINKSFQPILIYCPDSNAVYDYFKLIEELNILDSTGLAALKSCLGGDQ